MTVLHVIYEDTRRANLITKLIEANNDAKATRRKGYIGVHGKTYERQHEAINDIVTLLELLP